MILKAEAKLPSTLIKLLRERLGWAADRLTIERLSGDASARSYFRIRRSAAESIIIALYKFPFDERESALERLAKLERASPNARLLFANDPCAHIEVTELFARAGLPVPRILASLGSAGALLMEDVGDTRLQDWLVGRSDADILSAYRRAVEIIVDIQGLTPLIENTPSICWQLALDQEKLRWELDFFSENYFKRYLSADLSAEAIEAIERDFNAISRELAARPRALAHRDYHSRNLMMCGDQIFIIDHQDARMGPTSYDLASLLADPYVSLGDHLRAELLEYFIELKSASSGWLGDAGEFRREYYLMTVQRALKAVGTYAYQAAALNNQVYVGYIRPAINSALSAMSRLSGFDGLRAQIERCLG
jgi:aminoglycoside/choline kinase family phosphotransferase